MRVLHVIQRYYPYLGGAERYVQEISERLVADGHQVDLVTTDAWDWEHFWYPNKKRVDIAEETLAGVHIRRYPVRHIPVFPSISPRLRRVMMWLSTAHAPQSILWQLAEQSPRVPDLQRALRNTASRYDLIHATNILFDSMDKAAFDLARAQKIPFVFTPFVHLGEKQSDWLQKFYTMRHQLALMTQSDCVFVQTKREADFLQARGIAASKTILLGMGVTPSEISGGDAARFRARYNIRNPIVLFVGAVAYDKGATHLLEAMKRLWADGVDATLVLAGPAREPFLAFIDQQDDDVRKRCVLPGMVVGDDKRDLFAAANLFAMPSRSDAFGIVYLESWVCGLPVIGADAGGVPDVIDDGVDGFLVPFGDTVILAERIRRLLNDPALAQKMGERGKAKVLARFTWDRVYEDVLANYRRLVEQRV